MDDVLVSYLAHKPYLKGTHERGAACSFSPRIVDRFLSCVPAYAGTRSRSATAVNQSSGLPPWSTATGRGQSLRASALTSCICLIPLEIRSDVSFEAISRACGSRRDRICAGALDCNLQVSHFGVPLYWPENPLFSALSLVEPKA